MPADFISLFDKNRDKLIPSKGKTNVGRGDFKKIGDKFFNDIVDTCKLTPEAKILDVGSGIGRIARPFTKFLNKDGNYLGFDIIKSDIEWCAKKYSQCKNFVFNHYPIKNDLYLPNANISPEEFEFPFKEESFDVVIVISVFTHMQFCAIENYLKEIAKVLKPQGTCYTSWFLAEADKTYELFPFIYDKYCLHNSKIKNANVALIRNQLLQILKTNGLEIVEEKQGWWKTGISEKAFDFQDILVLKKV